MTSRKYIETDAQGKEVIRWKTSGKPTKEEHTQMLAEFDKATDAGQVVCLTDLFVNSGM